MAAILLADDNPALLIMQARFLRIAGHTVSTAANGVEALSKLEAAAFELLVTDMVMPEKEGIELIIEARRKWPGLKIIAISGGGRVNARDYLFMAEKLGAARTLTKPFTGRELVEAVTAVLAG